MKKIKYYSLIIVSFCLFFHQASAQSTSSRVLISHGLVKGTLENEVSVFKGIPYAQPPVGELRWRPPMPVQGWEGELDATEFAANCAQGGWGAQSGTIANGSSENCLNLNIWTPANIDPASKSPVMVWIHGDGFTGGSGSSPQNYGTEFAKQGVTLVTINYRLGRLGFFAHPALSKEFPDEPKGNYGYMDQIAALKWVQENIANFGGDPDNVTIFGCSAGGVSVQSLLTIPSAKGLFHKVISESGGGRDGVLTGRPINQENADVLYKVSAETIGMNFAKIYGIEGIDSDAMKKLRALSVEEVVDGGQETDEERGVRIYSGPILDGKLVIETAESAYKTLRQPGLPMIIGNTSAEIGGNFVNNSSSKEEFFETFENLESTMKKAYDPDGNKSIAEVMTMFNTDWVWGEPARMAAKAFNAKGAPVFVYQFGFVPTSARERSPFGAGHCSNVSYVFNTIKNNRPPTAPEITTQEIEVAKTLNSFWANFAKTGNPNGENLPEWRGFDNEDQEILEITLDGETISKPHPRKERMDVLEKAFENRGHIQSHGI